MVGKSTNFTGIFGKGKPLPSCVCPDIVPVAGARGGVSVMTGCDFAVGVILLTGGRGGGLLGAVCEHNADMIMNSEAMSSSTFIINPPVLLTRLGYNVAKFRCELLASLLLRAGTSARFRYFFEALIDR